MLTASWLHRPRLEALGVIIALAFAAPQPVAAAASPFDRFVGDWRGGGEVVNLNGYREQIRCRAQYAEAKEGAALNLSIVCASQSYRIDIRGYVEASGGSVQGYWTELSRDLKGLVTGSISDGRFAGVLSSPTFTAALSLTSNGRTQTVSIQPQREDVTDVRIELRRG